MKRFFVLMLMIGLIFGFSGNLLAQDAKSKTPKAPCGVKTDGKIYTDYKGKRIYFPNKECLEKFKKNPEKYLKMMKKYAGKDCSAVCDKVKKPCTSKESTKKSEKMSKKDVKKKVKKKVKKTKKGCPPDCAYVSKCEGKKKSKSDK